MPVIALSPTSWARSDIAQRAADIAAAESNEHHRYWATIILEAVLALIDLAGCDATNILIEECLLDPSRLTSIWEAAKASGRFSESTLPVPALDALAALMQTPADVRIVQFCRVAQSLRNVPRK